MLARIVETPWRGGKALMVWSVPEVLLARRPDLRQNMHRDRYRVLVTDSLEAAFAACREMGIPVERIAVGETRH